MKTKDIIKHSFISLYKIIMYLALIALFIIPFSTVYYGLTYVTRTLVITCGSFVIVMILMLNIYGNFEIGQKKSKPVVFATFMNVFVTNIITLLALKVMAVHDAQPIKNDLFILLRVIIYQSIAIYAFTYFGNFIYFKMVDPIKVIVVHDDSIEVSKILSFLNRHKKQFDVLNVYNTNDVKDIEFNDVDQIFMLNMPFNQLSKVCRENFMSNMSVLYDATIGNTLGGSSNNIVIDDILMYEYKSLKMTLYQQFWKRVVDILIAIIALAIFSPFILIIAIAIKLDDGGPVFYTQRRMTKDGQIFEIVKFRSMKLNSGDRPAQKNDDRITKVGYYIRKFRMDEIPQFINILKGDMSIVGPRPESESLNVEITKNLPEFAYRLKVKAGLTGYAQIFGKYNTSPRKKLLLDLEYIENYSLLRDIKLIFQTIIVFVKKDSTEGFDSNEDNIH